MVMPIDPVVGAEIVDKLEELYGKGLRQWAFFIPCGVVHQSWNMVGDYNARSFRLLKGIRQKSEALRM